MKPKYLFSLTYLRKGAGVIHSFTEHVVAETWQQAREYWSREFDDPKVEIECLQRKVPVIAILPQDKR